MTTVSEIAKKHGKGVEEVKAALQTLGFSRRMSLHVKVEADFESKLNAHWQAGVLSDKPQTKAPPPKKVDRKISGTHIVEKPRRSFSRPTPAAKPSTTAAQITPPPPPKTPTVDSPPAQTAKPAPPKSALEEQKIVAAQSLLEQQKAAQEKKKPRPPPEIAEITAPGIAAPGIAAPGIIAPGTVAPKSPRKAGKKIKIDKRFVDKHKMRRERSKQQDRAPAANLHTFQKPTEPMVREVEIADTISVQRLSDQLAMKSGAIIHKLMQHGMTVTANELLDRETAWIIVEELGHKPLFARETDLENDMLDATVIDDSQMTPRPPVVTVMGHVDHGKTSLLDAIRKTRVAAGEAGGITQHIGAYQVCGKNGDITFIDTPGHELFTAMRARGVQVTDIVVLVIAADDGVRPQTEEAIAHAQTAGAPIIVAANKMDKPDADLERIRAQMGAHNITPEEWGGDTMLVPISAQSGDGIDNLLEAIRTQAEILELKAAADTAARGAVIEGRVEKGRGVVVTLIIRQGTLQKGDIFLCGTERGKVRAMWDSEGKMMTRARPAMPVEIQGLSGMPEVGADFIVLDDERLAREISDIRQDKFRQSKLATKGFAADPNALLLEADEVSDFNVIIRSDVSGSREALAAALEAIAGKNARVKVIHSGIGAVTESDIDLAQTSRALVVAFNVRPDARARQMANSRRVKIMNGNVIYDVVDKVRDAVLHSLAPQIEEKVIGQAKVLKVFAISKVGNIAGCVVTDGIARADAKVRIVRDGTIVHEGRVASLKHFKDDSAEVPVGGECGLAVQKFNDIKADDIIELLEVIETPRDL